MQRIEFNLSVVSTDKVEAGGGLKLSVMKAGVNSETGNESTNSLHFHITVALPTSAGAAAQFRGAANQRYNSTGK